MPFIFAAGGPGLGVELGDNPEAHAYPGEGIVKLLKFGVWNTLPGPLIGPNGEKGEAMIHP